LQILAEFYPRKSKTEQQPKEDKKEEKKEENLIDA